jgi:hypothetical protein
MMAEYDPILPPAKAAEYCGCSIKTLERFEIERHPIPTTGAERSRWGYRLSVLNAFLATLADPKARKPLVSKAS